MAPKMRLIHFIFLLLSSNSVLAESAFKDYPELSHITASTKELGDLVTNGSFNSCDSVPMALLLAANYGDNVKFDGFVTDPPHQLIFEFTWPSSNSIVQFNILDNESFELAYAAHNGHDIPESMEALYIKKLCETYTTKLMSGEIKQK